MVSLIIGQGNGLFVEAQKMLGKSGQACRVDGLSGYGFGFWGFCREADIQI